MLLPRAAPAAACTAVNGGATTMSTAAVFLTSGRRSVTNATASPTVLNIFQLPAIKGVRIKDCGGRKGGKGQKGSPPSPPYPALPAYPAYPTLSASAATPGSVWPPRNS